MHRHFGSCGCIKVTGVGSRITHSNCVLPLRSTPVPLRWRQSVALPHPHRDTQIGGLQPRGFDFRLLLFASLALILMIAVSSSSVATSPPRIVLTLSADARNLCLWLDLANFTGVNRGFQNPESLTSRHFLKRISIVIDTCSDIFTVQRTWQLTALLRCSLFFIKGSRIPWTTTLVFLPNAMSLEVHTI